MNMFEKGFYDELAKFGSIYKMILKHRPLMKQFPGRKLIKKKIVSYDAPHSMQKKVDKLMRQHGLGGLR